MGKTQTDENRVKVSIHYNNENNISSTTNQSQQQQIYSNKIKSTEPT